MLLLLVRHGVTELTSTQLVGRTPAVPLNATGRSQAEAVAERLGGLPVARVYSSPLDRALETAAPLAARRGIEVVPDADLAEVDYGEWTGQPYKTLMKTELWKRVQSTPSAVRFPGGEALYEVQARVVGCLDRLARAHRGELVAAFSHGDVIKAAVAHLLGMHLDLFQRLAVAPGSITAIAVGPDHPRLLRFNDGSDLTDLVPRKRRARRAPAHN